MAVGVIRTQSDAIQATAALEAVGQAIVGYGLVLVVGWIGAMKFTAYEAAGIQPLVATTTIGATAAPDARPSRRSRSRSSPTTPTRSALISGTRRWLCWGTPTAAASRCSTRCAIPAT